MSEQEWIGPLSDCDLIKEQSQKLNTTVNGLTVDCGYYMDYLNTIKTTVLGLNTDNVQPNLTTLEQIFEITDEALQRKKMIETQMLQAITLSANITKTVKHLNDLLKSKDDFLGVHDFEKIKSALSRNEEERVKVALADYDKQKEAIEAEYQRKQKEEEEKANNSLQELVTKFTQEKNDLSRAKATELQKLEESKILLFSQIEEQKRLVGLRKKEIQNDIDTKMNYVNTLDPSSIIINTHLDELFHHKDIADLANSIAMKEKYTFTLLADTGRSVDPTQILDIPQILLKKSNLLFIVVDTSGSIFGGFLGVKITDWVVMINTNKAFLFTLTAKKKKQIEIFRTKNNQTQNFVAFKKEGGILFAFGYDSFFPKTDLAIMKQIDASRSFSCQTMFDYHNKSNALCGEQYFNYKRLYIYQVS
uniref:TLDc domain-containing protein n=1 Tax=Entamoeba invadens TaxID=33085 RepID=S0B6Q7_ENTIV|nr:hypothetical protein [Entamoeba invadens]